MINLSNLKTRLHTKIYKALRHPSYEAVAQARSDSDSGYYPEAVRQSALSTKHFQNFKRNPSYQQILEHVSREQGEDYVREIRAQWPELMTRMGDFKINDLVGNPVRYSYSETGEISPTTLRYVKVASDFKKIFSSLDGMNVAEIGIGYGGQFLIADAIWKLSSWTLFDLDPVLALASRYLECQITNSCYKTTTLNRFDAKTAGFDFVISNYAFSELPRVLQHKYVEKVIAKSKAGYMTMNSGTSDRNDQRMTVDELRRHLPDLRVIEERPLTAPSNYILLWGETAFKGAR